MTLELTSLEHRLITDLIARELYEMPSEVRRTQTSTYRDELKNREQHLRELLKRMDETK